MTRSLGIDFGTSNSAAGFMQDGQPRLITFDGAPTLPTTFFFDFDTRQTLLGEPANQALLEGFEGRFMRALKRVLGTTLMHEKRQILNSRVTFVEIIARFLKHIKTQAERQTGLTFDRAVAGRPVVFHGTGDPREQQAEDDLRTCYLAAGFSEVTFVPEPEAAAIADGALVESDGLGLIVDIGGGTSDFSLFRTSSGSVDILANHGVRIGGTDFDRALSFSEVMPYLGKGSLLRDQFGPGRFPAPNAIFNDLATWEKIPFLYTAQIRRKVADMEKQAVEPEKLGRLADVLRDELGHDIAFATERGKIAANDLLNDPRIDLTPVESGLSVPLPTATLTEILAPFGEDLRQGVQDTLKMANLSTGQIDRVIYVGGSSMLHVVSDAVKSVTPEADHSFSEVFTAVTDGLARATDFT
ncbi:putative chaperone protein [Shimia isoporae]|uniref:Putative chaperone protein n=1 Tax=Shimia isoporae TaxID=647720 RepID=A0A4R1NQ74_9RHOB|nr:Hsp70 family protein [Shimia isoporae]TCL08833.1 putative chaperone protein [Shimia isoporae]